MCARPVQIKLNQPPAHFASLVEDTSVSPQTKYRSLAQVFSSQILEALASGRTVPFLSSWKPGVGMDMPFNPFSGTVYRGINRLMLSYYLEKMSHRDPRFMSERQVAKAAKKQWHIKPQATAHWVVHWKWSIKKPLLDPDGKKMLDEDGKPLCTEFRLAHPIATYRQVYHASDVETCDGNPIPEFTPPPCTWDVNARILALQNNMDLPVEHITGDSASYSPLHDRIRLPFRSLFVNEGEYNSTLLHEAVHATGHPDRLNRPEIKSKKDKDCEELVAEMGAWMLCQQLHVPHFPKNNLAYIQMYSKHIQNDPYIIMRAARDAEMATQYILENWDDPRFKTQTAARAELVEDLEGMLDAFDGLEPAGDMDFLPPAPLAAEPEPSMFF